MKKVLALLVVVLLLSGCEKPGDCVKSTGPMTSKEFDGLVFTKILVRKGISLVIKQGSEYKVEVRTGENLINDIEVSVADGMLTLADNTTCNWTRNYGETVVYITAPNLTDIFSKTEKTIISDGLLAYENLRLVSMDPYDGFTGIGTGDFILEVNNDFLTIDNNDVSRFFITGNTNQMKINFYESGGIFHGENLYAKLINVYHRGTNDIVLFPVDAIRGDIYNTGNVICVHRPPVVEVRQHYRGRLIFY